MKRRGRSDQSLKRRKPFIAPRECILIVCEGEKTEPYYFMALRKTLGLSSVEVEIAGEGVGSAAISVVTHAVDQKRLRKTQALKSQTLIEFDRVWCIIDVEAPTEQPSLVKALNKARDNEVEVALSNPCFEYWYLLHFKKTSVLMQTNKKVLQELNKAMQAVDKKAPKYKKNDKTFFSRVYPLTADAIKNAKAVINEKHYGANLRNCNPSTHVHLVVEQLQKISSITPTQ